MKQLKQQVVYVKVTYSLPKFRLIYLPSLN